MFANRREHQKQRRHCYINNFRNIGKQLCQRPNVTKKLEGGRWGGGVLFGCFHRNLVLRNLHWWTSNWAEQVAASPLGLETLQVYWPESPDTTLDNSRVKWFSLATILALSATDPSRGLLSFSQVALRPWWLMSVAQLKTAVSPAGKQFDTFNTSN